MMAKIDSAVNCGRKLCITPAENNLTPTAQKVNHLPIRLISAPASDNIDASATTEISGSTSISGTMAADKCDLRLRCHEAS